ncbi:hypothetical protein [Chelatococcus asaccharovorans]|uniref:Glutamine amidotransferase n=1 Tax=Chelatococcus asaccharovorans TaxID=28210 RepID=A0A2V3U0Q6_9HYPH|nr:hypothetical protein [Chelatococcus asaccharovorans]MBS7704450.1 hypothetical protein [Chelatococcus asaccharovorans]PXW55669.1 hypothetical protein C7450_10977 [Chelatococcus asaccharovorans]CAH1663581.1 Threonine dehydrogenase and related Zn-dependent dehydrogenases [Chelatococcus asaccharovorans]CAH1682767.1 Threonine dehydrogenase and related Zn-dependent dehydrogenases [Chelatococcus asaccharovorans]
MLSLSFSPLVPLSVIYGLAALVAIAVVVAVLARGTVAIVRALALALLLAGLANPAIVQENREKAKDIAVVVVDRSGSQQLGDRRAQTDAAASALEQRLAQLPDIETRIVDVPDGAGDEGTRLFTALGRALADVPAERVAGAIMVTDGVVHDIPANADQMGFKAPLHALITGRPDERDRRVALIEAPRFGIVGRDQILRVQASERGGNGRMRLTVRRDGQVLLTREILADAPLSIPVRIEHGGPNIVEVEVDAMPGELTTANNRQVVTIEGVRDKLRVLLVSGEPHPGERTWRNLLKSDANVDLVHFTILRPPEKQDGTPINELSLIAFPTRALFQQRIKDFDLIIFDRYANQSVLPSMYYDNIVQFVQDGGALLVAAGPEFASSASLARTSLGAVLPATPDGRIVERPFRADVTAAGSRHPVTRELPGGDSEPPSWGEWLRLLGSNVRGGAVVMAGAEERPLLVLNREGKGRVALLLSDHVWLWARGFENGGPHVDLLRRLAHWMMKEPELEEEALRASARGTTISVERQTMADQPPPVRLFAPGGEERELVMRPGAPGLFTSSATVSELGLYRLTSGDLTAFVSVGPENPRELADVFSDTGRLEPITRETGGSARRIAPNGSGMDIPRVLTVSSGSRFSGGDWIGLKPSDSAIVRGVTVVPLGLGFAGLALLAGVVLAAWLVEGQRRRRS